MYPEGLMFHFCPSTWSERAGMLKLDLLVDARWIQRLVRRARVRGGEGLLVIGFREFYESAGKRCLLEYPESAVRGRVVRVQRLEPLGVVGTLGGWNRRALN